MHPAVNYLISMSGSAGELAAFAGEFQLWRRDSGLNLFGGICKNLLVKFCAGLLGLAQQALASLLERTAGILTCFHR
jgi:hypothetical protein